MVFACQCIIEFVLGLQSITSSATASDCLAIKPGGGGAKGKGGGGGKGGER